MERNDEFLDALDALREAIDKLASLGVAVDMERPITDEMLRGEKNHD